MSDPLPEYVHRVLREKYPDPCPLCGKCGERADGCALNSGGLP